MSTSGTAFFLFSLCIGAVVAATVDPDFPQYNMNSVNESTDDVVQQVMERQCRSAFSPFCFKLGLIKLVSRGSGMTLAILPGVSLSSSPTVGEPRTSANVLVDDPGKIDALLLDRFSEYIGSLSLNVKIMDKATPLNLARAYLGDDAFTPRKKNRFGGALLAAALMPAVTLLAAALAALAAMSGKAMMASLLALMMAALAALKGHGGGEKTTYEVITKPVVNHLHSHSSEIQHAGGHGHYRSIDGAPVAHDIVYAQQIPEGYMHHDIQ